MTDKWFHFRNKEIKISFTTNIEREAPKRPEPITWRIPRPEAILTYFQEWDFNRPAATYLPFQEEEYMKIKEIIAKNKNTEFDEKFKCFLRCVFHRIDFLRKEDVVHNEQTDI